MGEKELINSILSLELKRIFVDTLLKTFESARSRNHRKIIVTITFMPDLETDISYHSYNYPAATYLYLTNIFDDVGHAINFLSRFGIQVIEDKNDPRFYYDRLSIPYGDEKTEIEKLAIDTSHSEN